jgi:hypothetical protein
MNMKYAAVQYPRSNFTLAGCLLIAGSRWVPVKRGAPLSGILVLRDLTPDEPIEQTSITKVACCVCAVGPLSSVCFAGSRWVPVKRGAPLSGILVLRDLTPDEPIEYASSGTAGGPAAPGAAAAAGAAGAAGQQPQQQEQEAAPPAPFGEFGGLIGSRCICFFICASQQPQPQQQEQEAAPPAPFGKFGGLVGSRYVCLCLVRCGYYAVQRLN